MTRKSKAEGAAPADRTEVLVRYFVERFSGEVGRTQIVKYLYLADLEARRYLGRPVSSLRWKKHNFGPFDARVLQAMEQLEKEGAIQAQQVSYPNGKQGFLYHASAPMSPHGLSRAEEAILAYVASTYGAMPLKQLLDDVVYQSEPMKRVSDEAFDEELPMECVNLVARKRLGGIDLEDVLEAEDELDRGLKVSLTELERELLGRSGS